MTGRERVLAALKCQPTDCIPWVPFAGCHAAALIGVSADRYLRSSELIVQAVGQVIECYQPDGVPVIFDLQLEAEVLGCELLWAPENPPSVISHPLAEGRELSALTIPEAGSGRIRIVLDAARELRQNHSDVALYGLITGPFTLALHLLGTQIFMEMYDDPDRVSRIMRFSQDIAIRMAGFYIDAGCDVIAVVDPMTSQIGPQQFRQFVAPYITPVFDFIRSRAAASSFFVCGHAQQNITAMSACRPDNISVDENIPLAFVRDECLPHGVSFGGNIPLTTVLLLGTPEDAQRSAVDCMEIGGRSGFILAPGCDLPYATPPANLKAVTEVVRDPYRYQIIQTLAATPADGEQPDMRDYGQGNQVIVDIITLDSEACAPCQYMVEAVRKITPEFEGLVEWREHKIKQRESLQFMNGLMVKNVPTICIDGQITFVSRIPARDELIRAIQQRINTKLRLRIQRHHASVYILGDGGAACQQTEQNIHCAAAELGMQARTEIVTDEAKIHTYGITLAQTPAVVIARYQLKSQHEIPSVPIIKEWLKDLI